VGLQPTECSLWVDSGHSTHAAIGRKRSVIRPLRLWRLSWHLITCMEQRMTEVYQGSCLCAAVVYELLGPPKAVSHCYCSQCRKAHGAAFASYGSVPRGALQILRGSSWVRSYASSEIASREFCGQCGSTLFWSRSKGEFADWISIALGTLDTPFMPQTQKHVHIESAAPWWPSSSQCPPVS
jgi:hypothetical protein